MTPARDPADLGDDAFAAGDFSRAVECYDVALAASDDPRVFLSRGRALAALERWPAALRDADRAAARRGVWLAPRILRGACLESLGRWRAAARCYRDASRLPEAPGTRAHVTSTRVADDIDADAKPGSEGSRVGEGEGEGGEGEDEPSSRVGSRPRAAADEIREGLRRASRAIASRDAVAATRGHAGPVTAVAFAPACVVFPADDPVLATASEDGTVRLWRAANVASRADATELVDDETSADSATTRAIAPSRTR